jgi:RNA polymerase sigma-32 factor
MSRMLQPMVALSPGGNINAYIQAVGAFPVLSQEREQELAQALYYREDLASARELVLAHLRFVVHIARSYSGYGLPLSDLVQEGNVGLMKAVRRFDPDRGVRLVSFAVHWIKAEIHEYIIQNWRIVKVATTKAQRKLFFNLRKYKNRLGWLNSEEAHTIAEELDVDVATVYEMEGRLSSHDMAFDASDDSEDGEKDLAAPVHYLKKSNADPAELLEESDWEENEQSRLISAIETLDDRSRDIVKSRWLSEEKLTLHDLAARYNVSAERIRQLESSAMKRIKLSMAA